MATKDYNRQANGYFGPGNDGGPGRPRRAIEAATLAALTEVWDEDAVKDVAKALLARARAGDTTAARLVLEYQAGKPTERLEVTAGEQDNFVLRLPSAESDTPALPAPSDGATGETAD
jgi:hypothetical protein